MRAYFKQIWSDVSQRKNLELYISLGLAVIVLALDIFNAPVEAALNEIVLTVLALLIFGMIEDRRRDERMGEALRNVEVLLEKSLASDRIGAEKFFVERLPALEPHLEKARHIQFCGVVKNRSIRNNMNLLVERLKSGASIQVILVDPYGESAKSIANPEDNFPLEMLQTKSKATFDNLSWLAKLPTSRGSVELRYIDEGLLFTMSAVDVNEEDGIMFVEIYAQRYVEGKRPKMVLSRDQDGNWYDFYRDQFNLLWEDACPVPLNNTQAR